MREQIRLWFYSQCFMSVTLTGRSPYERVLTYEKLLDETGREMHRSWGNAIDVDEAFERMGADVMRWQFSAQPPSQNLLFGFGPAHEIKRRLLTLWNSAKFLADYANIDEWRPAWSDLANGPDGELQPLDRWLVARTSALVAETTAAYESWLDGQRRPCLRRIRRGRVELVHPAVSSPLLGRRRGRVSHALVRARAGSPDGCAGHAVPRRPPLA